MPSAATLRARIESSLGERLSSTLLFRERAAPLMVSTGVAALDALTGGLPRGALSEIAGSASSGRTGLLLAALTLATRRQEVCALVDASDSFDPASAASAGMDLDRLLWVRCGQQANSPHRKDSATRAGFALGGVLEQILKVTDLLLQSGGFGMVVLDLGDVPVESARRVPLTSWFRFRRAIEPTSTVLLLIEQEPCAKTCASLVVQLEREAVCARDSAPVHARVSHAWMPDPSHAWVPQPCSPLARGWECEVTQGPSPIPRNNLVSHAALLHGMRLRAEVARSWTLRKPAQAAGANFELRTGL
jgi:hypothetical protein